MKKIFLVLFLLCLVPNVFAQTSSQDWNSSWGFQHPLEKANVLNQALDMEFIKDGGYSNSYTTNNNGDYFQEQNCNTDGSCFNGNSTSIGNNIVVNGEGNVVTSTNEDTTVSADNTLDKSARNTTIIP